MNKNFKKTVKMTAAAIFLMALAVNVSVTGDDSFEIESQQALADINEPVACWNKVTTKEASQVFFCGECDWVSGTYTWDASKGECP